MIEVGIRFEDFEGYIHNEDVVDLLFDCVNPDEIDWEFYVEGVMTSSWFCLLKKLKEKTDFCPPEYWYLKFNEKYQEEPEKENGLNKDVEASLQFKVSLDGEVMREILLSPAEKLFLKLIEFQEKSLDFLVLKITENDIDYWCGLSDCIWSASIKKFMMAFVSLNSLNIPTEKIKRFQVYLNGPLLIEF